MATDVAMSGTEGLELPPRKKPKVSELPLSSAQRASIDGMLHTFKKKGEFDIIRKKAFQQYNESANRGMFEAALRNFTTSEIDREPVKYLKPDRRMGAPLLEGAAARANMYTQTETDVDSYIEQYLASAEQALREIRRLEIGDEAAQEEMRRGSKSDEAYAAEAEVRRSQRAAKHMEEEKIRRKQAAQEKKKKELEALKKKQEELMKETERLQREQKRRAEREAWKQAEKERERERIRKFNEERERAKKEQEAREQAAKEEREKRQRERDEREQKRLEDEALHLLLREGKEMAEKGKRPELERSESMEPPPRLMRHSAPRNTLSRDEMRARGLMPTSMTLRKGDKPTLPPAAPNASASALHGPSIESERRRPLRPRSPSPAPSSHGRRRELSPDDDRRSRRDNPRRETLYRDISVEREAWKARHRTRDDVSRGEEGELVERDSTRARSRSRDSYRRRRDSRSPPRRRHRDNSRSRSAPRYRDRSRTRRERSRSPPGIDRYIPGGIGNARKREDGDRDRDRDRDRERDRRRRGDSRDYDRRRREDRYDDRPKPVEIDRYIPHSPVARRRERSRSRDRDRDRERDRERHRGRSRDRDRERIRGHEKDEAVEDGMREPDRDRELSAGKQEASE
ncbi:hypothetical protein M433DRAFT_153218 [Acidomyces richmondensis BFW]|nr:MAG: hypothetical protein FE78DRAFT_88836 [Acidomyces sp. 'richmondensis']KYG46535.1 hypothetical protein M433DRAFT_153218 [Acidomyces richmondensis BFW]